MKNYSNIILFALIAIVGVFTLDVYLPAMPVMSEELDVSINQIAFTFTGFSIVFAFSQLIHGALSDCYGRKPVLLLGLSIAAIATIFCIIAERYEMFLISRLVQAIGISSFVVLNAIIRDLYTGSKAVQVRTFVTTVGGISISIAPTIGSLLLNKLSWQGGFVVSLLLIAATILFASLFYKESNINRSKFNAKEILNSYVKLYSNPQYFLHGLQSTLAYTVHFVFIIMSAKIFIQDLGIKPLKFGYLMFGYGAVYFVSGLVSSTLIKKYSISKLITFGGTLIGFSGIIMFFSSLIISLNIWQILIPMSLITTGITIIRACATTGALGSLASQAGQGAAGLNLVQFLISALIATVLSSINIQPHLVLSLLAIICGLIIMYLMKHIEWIGESKILSVQLT